jgi:hypothetical protein
MRASRLACIVSPKPVDDSMFLPLGLIVEQEPTWKWGPAPHQRGLSSLMEQHDAPHKAVRTLGTDFHVNIHSVRPLR